MPQNVQDKLKLVTPAVAFSETQLHWPVKDWHLKETHLHPSMELLQQIWFKRHTVWIYPALNKRNQFKCQVPLVRGEPVHVHQSGLVLICATGGMPLHVEGRILVQDVLSLAPHLPWVAAQLHLGDIPPLYSISSCLCSGLCVSPSRWLGLYNVTDVLWAICYWDKDVLRWSTGWLAPG